MRNASTRGHILVKAFMPTMLFVFASVAYLQPIVGQLDLPKGFTPLDIGDAAPDFELPRLNQTDRSAPWQDELDEEARQLVKRWYRRDFPAWEEASA